MNPELQDLKDSILVLDIETCASYPDGRPVDIRADFETYVERAKCKWFGCYSYKYDKYVCDEVLGNEERIRDFIDEHKVIVGFNNEEFDTPVLCNNNLMSEKRFLQVDNMIVLGSSTFFRHDGMPFKNRGGLMGYKFPNNKLSTMAEIMGLETQKGDIDYTIFFQDTYTDQERKDILKYLESDVKATKEMFDKLWDFWMPFTKFLSEKNVMNLSWIRSSIASLRYKGDCHTLGVEETYGERTESKEEMGGRVITPKYEEATGVWYIDFGSLYPWLRNMFGIDNEMSSDDIEMATVGPMGNGGGESDIWHGNDLFKVKGYYDVSEQSPIALKSIENLNMRAKMKKDDPENPMIYAVKIYENAGYGALRSQVFEQIHTPNAGWDICWLGQQFQKLTEDMFTEFGFETIYGDTDSIQIKFNGTNLFGDDAVYIKEYEKQYVKECIQKILDKIKENVPFPSETFTIDLEYPDALEYIMWPFADTPVSFKDIGLSNSELLGDCIPEEIFEKLEKYYPENNRLGIKNVLLALYNKSKDKKEAKINLKTEKGRLIKEYKGKKKNYVYLYKKGDETKLKIMGLPIIKDNSTALGKVILEKELKPTILSMKKAKFSKNAINQTISDYLKKPEALELLSVQYKVKPDGTYKLNKDGTPSNNIYAQISRGYFDGQDGIIRLIKNKVCGNAGKTSKYCSIQEAIDNNLTMDDIDLTKLTNELSPFVEK